MAFDSTVLEAIHIQEKLIAAVELCDVFAHKFVGQMWSQGLVVCAIILFRISFIDCGIRQYALCASIPQGKFTNVTVPSGFSNIIFSNIPKGSRFVVMQLHSPFNRLLASSSSKFVYEASQLDTHCGLSLVISNETSNVTMYVYSDYITELTAWARADAYDDRYPLPGGCSVHSRRGFAPGALTTIIKEDRASDSSPNVTLNYWTSLISFTASSLPSSVGGDRLCSFSNSSFQNLIYRLYGMPLITAGGSYGAFVNPTPEEAAEVLEQMSSVQASEATLLHSFRLNTPGILNRNLNAFVPIARRPATAVVVTLIVEYRSDKFRSKVAYAPTVLYGCQAAALSYTHIVQNFTSRLQCALLPKTSPNTYFGLAVLLLTSVLYACSCSLFIWFRCALGLFSVASLMGAILAARYSFSVSNSVCLMVFGTLLPGLLALALFIVLWCLYVRPTLRIRHVFGRGSLMALTGEEELVRRNRREDPWNANLVTSPQLERYHSGKPLFYQNNTEQLSVTPVNTFNPLPPVSEELPTWSALDASSPTANTISFVHPSDAEFPDDLIGQDRCTNFLRFHLCPRLNQCNCVCCMAGRQPRMFSLKPRRIARLPPVFLASFLVVSFFAILLDRILSLRDSPAAYVTFVVLLGFVVAGLLCIFKNLAFGLSTAFVGIYLCFSCICLFNVPGGLLPHIIIEQFLRLAWPQHRLQALRVEFYGMYDVLLVIAWFFLTIMFGLITLCLVRLQDARELAEAQCGRSAGNHRNETTSAVAANSSLLVDAAALSQKSWPFFFRSGPSFNPLPPKNGRDPAPSVAALFVNSEGESSELSTQRSLDQSNVPKPVTERAQLLAGHPWMSSYGSLASTSQAPLMPLSRVQLAAGGGSTLANNPLRPGLLSLQSFSPTPDRLLGPFDPGDAPGWLR
ncbi:unnamed protein product [Calicophoron daubneyi]|uniref:Transmembrane protein n=1 Tax=Calicophoron daubneyi TaxID=300641 RepID=A0AAV2T1F4_CALDB